MEKDTGRISAVCLIIVFYSIKGHIKNILLLTVYGKA